MLRLVGDRTTVQASDATDSNLVDFDEWKRQNCDVWGRKGAQGRRQGDKRGGRVQGGIKGQEGRKGRKAASRDMRQKGA